MMLALGPYRFSLNTAAYQTLKRSTEYRWSRIGSTLQALGNSDKIDLEGVIYFRGGFNQIKSMRENQQKPLLLINALGEILGTFVITRIEETQTTFLPNGIARKIEFRLNLERYAL